MFDHSMSDSKTIIIHSNAYFLYDYYHSCQICTQFDGHIEQEIHLLQVLNPEKSYYWSVFGRVTLPFIRLKALSYMLLMLYNTYD